MPNYGVGGPPPDKTPTSYYAGFRRWLQIKKYQYEVTFSLYMLTNTEKFVFNVIILVLMALLITAAVAYLPNHLVVISNRLWYYVHGELLYSTSSNSNGNPKDVTAQAKTREIMDALVATTVGMTGRMKQTGMYAGRGDEF